MNQKYELIWNDNRKFDYSDKLEKKVKDLKGDYFKAMDDWLWDNTLLDKKEYFSLTVRNAFSLVLNT